MKPADKANDIRKLQNELMNTDVSADITADRCVQCKQPATQFNDALSRKEYTLSGMCQRCQDRFFNQPMDDDAA